MPYKSGAVGWTSPYSVSHRKTTVFAFFFLNFFIAFALADCLPSAIAQATASGNDGNVAANSIDDSLATRWSNLGKGSYLFLDLGSVKSVCDLQISWYNGDERANNFIIAASVDGTTFMNIFSGQSSGLTSGYEQYNFQDIAVRYVMIIVNGNTQNDWASISEVKIDVNPLEADEVGPIMPSASISHSPSSPSSSQSVTLTAMAKGDLITKIEIYRDGSMIGSCAVSGLSASCAKLTGPFAAGTQHSYYSNAYDSHGRMARSSAGSFTVQSTTIDTKPAVSVVHSPSSPTSMQSVTFTATATDDKGISKIEIFIDGVLAAACSASPCSKTAGPYAAGSSHSYYAKAYDTISQMTQAASKSFTVQAQAALSISFSNVVEGQSLSGSYKAVVAASDSSKVSNIKLYVDAILLGTQNSTPYEFIIDTAKYAAGSHALKAVATDTSGNANAASASVNAVFGQSSTDNPPTISTSHSPISPTSSQSVTFTVTASDDIGLAKVELFVDGVMMASCSASPCAKVIGPFAAGSSHSYYAKAYDTIGQVATASTKSFTVQSTVDNPPAVSVSHSPIPGTTADGKAYVALVMHASWISNSDFDNMFKGNLDGDDMIRYRVTDYPSGYDQSKVDYLKAFRASVPGLKLGISIAYYDKIAANAAKLKSLGFDFVEYNLESGFDGPNDDLQASNNVAKIKAAADAVHAQGMKFRVTPGKPNSGSFQRTGLLDDVAKLVDYYHIQAQSIQDVSPDAYADFTESISKDLRAAKPEILITSQVSPGQGFQSGKTVQQTMRDVIAEAMSRPAPGNTQGAGMWISGNDVSEAKSFFTWFADTYPTAGSSTSSQSVAFTATATDDIGLSSMQIFVDGVSIGSCTVSGTSAACAKTAGPYAEGSSHSYYAKATDTKGQTAQSATKGFTVGGGTTTDSPPAVSVSHSPSSPASTQQVTITASATDDMGISKVEVFIDGVLMATCASSPCSKVSGPFAAGSSHSYYAKAYDTIGQVATASTKSFTVQSTVDNPPAVSVSHSPASPTSSQLVTFTATASDDIGLAKVEIFIDSVLIRTCAASPCAHAAGPYLAGSSHSYYAKATDSKGQVTQAASKSFTVQGGTTTDLLAAPVFVKKWPTGMEMSSVDVASTNDVYAAPHDNRVQVYTFDGTFKFQFGSAGSTDGQFQHPHGIAIDRTTDTIYVGDQENHRIQVFNKDGQFIKKYVNSDLVHIHDIGIDPNQGWIYAPDYEVDHLQKINPDTGAVIWKRTGLNGAWGVSVDSQGFVYLAVTNSQQLHKIDSANGNTVKSVGGFSSGQGITGVYVDKHDLVYAVDNPKKKVFIYDTNLALKATWDLVAICGSGVAKPEDISISSDDKNIYVADSVADVVCYMKRQ